MSQRNSRNGRMLYYLVLFVNKKKRIYVSLTYSLLYLAAPPKNNVNPVTTESTINPTTFKQILNKEK